MNTGGRTTLLGKVITAGMIVYLLVIGVMSFGVFQIGSCLNDYIEANANATNARSELARQDRELDLRDAVLTDRDRDANRAFAKALSKVLTSFDKPKSEQKTTYFELIAQDKKTAATLDADEREREQIRRQRAANEESRKANPPPPPPSQSC